MCVCVCVYMCVCVSSSLMTICLLQSNNKAVMKVTLIKINSNIKC